MRAIRVREFGPPEVLRLEEDEKPTPGEGEVLVSVELASVIYGDVIVRSGGHPFELPYIPGNEVAGTDHNGRIVVGTTAGNSGGYAEFARCTDVYEVPSGVSLAQALAVFEGGYLANAMLEEMGPADTVLITAAAGRIGSLLVQLAKARGATVIAAASGEKLDTAAKFGADVLVDYRDPDWAGKVKTATGGGADVTLEAIGGRLGAQALEATRGRFGVYGFASGSWTDPGDRELVSPLRTIFARPQEQHRRGVEEILRRAAQLIPLPTTTFPLEDAGEAHAALESRRTVGAVSLSLAATR
ncbi:zinc-binding dehydrogenase [Amycolatopsis alkalitolerans]|uniref:Zinc-binding dehydrogenase n=1 Tax=Amycolatopsis alkalitolerans TaxID=2547244 RepID=A0A5C4LR83_9PSEU|nr:zinc-binding dehydrogenase [Amycolatopsis alkalitolerans]TNC21144.1 zinc-binding dehydrogenase [Amycolatopsis alkalitolerans]